MSAHNGKHDSWRKTVQLISHCPVCSLGYPADAIRVFSDEHETKFVHFTCPNCRTYFMAIFLPMPKGISTVGMVTDLSFEDMKKLYSLPSISVDEMIEGRQFFNKDFILPVNSGKK
jgi:hypothetical protein